jgi:hypothetical protein
MQSDLFQAEPSAFHSNLQVPAFITSDHIVGLVLEDVPDSSFFTFFKHHSVSDLGLQTGIHVWGIMV